LHNTDPSAPPTPKALAKVAATPHADFDDSYESIISNPQWSKDSQTILFLAQNSNGERRLHEADVVSGALRTLTAAGFDVNNYSVAANTIAYTATSSKETVSFGSHINTSALDVTGLPLSSFLFVDPMAANSLRCNHLYVSRDNNNERVTSANHNKPACLVNRSDNVLSLSPDGERIVVLSPVERVPDQWRSYEPAFPHRKIDPDSPDTTARTNPLRPAQYELINLENRRRLPLVHAPNAWTLGYSDVNSAAWSHSGTKVLLSNTFLPLDDTGTDERSKRLRPCVVAIVDLMSNTSGCVVFSTYPARDLLLISASFGNSDRDVVLDFADSQNRTTRQRFRWNNERWEPSNAAHEHEDEPEIAGPSKPARAVTGGHGLSVEIRQDLNTPPAIWALDRRSGRSEKLWDPNPHLATFALGEVSVFQWVDSTGQRWTAGLVKPPDYIAGKRYPLVLQTHGFIEQEFMTDGQYTTAFAARPLAAAGMVVLQVRKNYSYRSLAEEAALQVRGFKSAIEQLAYAGLIDPDKVGIIGFSRSCYHVETALITNPRLFAAATIADGVDESYMQELLFGVGLATHESSDIYQARPFGEGLINWVNDAPGFQLDKAQTPLRIEALTPAGVLGEWEIYASLWMQQKAVDLIYIPDGQHILQTPLERIASQQGNVDWFRFWLKGEEDPDPAKAEQYARWRELRKLQEKSVGSSTNH
jgi:hypothetical protein